MRINLSHIARSKLSYKNLSSSQYHRRLFYDATNDLCEPEVTCSADVILSPYRTIDGSCNNFNRPHWGMAGRSQKRILRPFFDDGKSLVRNLYLFRMAFLILHLGPYSLTVLKNILYLFF